VTVVQVSAFGEPGVTLSCRKEAQKTPGIIRVLETPWALIGLTPPTQAAREREVLPREIWRRG
jgi:hypothetical protein